MLNISEHRIHLQTSLSSTVVFEAASAFFLFFFFFFPAELSVWSLVTFSRRWNGSDLSKVVFLTEKSNRSEVKTGSFLQICTLSFGSRLSPRALKWLLMFISVHDKCPSGGVFKIIHHLRKDSLLCFILLWITAQILASGCFSSLKSWSYSTFTILICQQTPCQPHVSTSPNIFQLPYPVDLSMSPLLPKLLWKYKVSCFTKGSRS